MKKSLILSLCLTWIINMSAIQADTTLTDIADHWAVGNITQLVEQGIINGFEDGTFRPQETITAEQFIKLVVVALDRGIGVEGDTWSYPYRAKAYELGLVDDIDTFNDGLSWNAAITREQMAVIMVKAVELGEEIKVEASEMDFMGLIEDIEDIDGDNLDYVYKSYTAGLIQGYEDETFRPAGYLTRAEATTVIIRLLDPEKRPELVLPEPVDYGNIEELLEGAHDTDEGPVWFSNISEWEFYSNGWSKMVSSNRGNYEYLLSEERTKKLVDIITNIAPLLVDEDYIALNLYNASPTEYELYVTVQRGNENTQNAYFRLEWYERGDDYDPTWHESFSDDIEFGLDIGGLKPQIWEFDDPYNVFVQAPKPDGSYTTKTFYDIRYYNQLYAMVKVLVGEESVEDVMAHLIYEKYDYFMDYDGIEDNKELLEETAYVDGIRIDHTKGSLGAMFYFSDVE